MAGSATSAPSDAVAPFWACDTLEKATALLEQRHTTGSGGQGILTLQNYVDGEFITPPASSSSPESTQWIDTVDPKTGRAFARMPCTSASDVEAATRAAGAAFKSWSRTARAERTAALTRVSQLIQANHELFSVWESVDQGKTLARARREVDRAVSNFAYFATFITHESTTARVIDGIALTYEHRSPLGPFALISPWNMPLYLLTWKVAPCLAFGCTAVAKPSEVTSVSAFLLAEVVRQAGLPPGVFNLVLGDGPTTGAAMVRSPLLRGVSFTGGTATGIQIRRDTVTDVGKHLSLELGGKNPTLVFDDVDLSRAVATAASAAFENQGEICLTGSRIYVQRSIYAAFVAAYTEFVRRTYILGETIGAVVSLQHYAKVRSYLALAQQEGAAFELGGVPPETPEAGYWIEPVVLTSVAASSRVLSEEIFGPVVTITPFDGEDEAVALANDNPNGLAAVLLTRDGARMRRVGEQLEAGLVWVNCWLVRELGTPFGGMKSSGVGREGGEYSRDVFTAVRTIHMPSV